MRYALQRFTDEGKAILLINLAVTVLMAYVLSLWISLAISQKMSDAPVYTALKSTITATPYRKTDYSIIKRRNIFDSSPAAAKSFSATNTPSAAVAEAAPPTALNLKLVGTIITDSGADSFAVIEDKSKQQKLYALNDEPAPGARIAQIDRFSVLIDNSGRMESLTMEFEKGFPKGKKGKGRGRRKPPQMGTMNPDVMKVGTGHVIMDKRYLEKQLADMNSLMTQVRVVPHKAEDGSMEGFKLFQLNKGSVYDKIGLKNSDIVQRVNGQPLDSVESGLDLFYALKNETNFTVDIKRNNSKQTLTVNVQ